LYGRLLYETLVIYHPNWPLGNPSPKTSTWEFEVVGS
jgi:hypothetical protein